MAVGKTIKGWLKNAWDRTDIEDKAANWSSKEALAYAVDQHAMAESSLEKGQGWAKDLEAHLTGLGGSTVDGGSVQPLADSIWHEHNMCVGEFSLAVRRARKTKALAMIRRNPTSNGWGAGSHVQQDLVDEEARSADQLRSVVTQVRRTWRAGMKTYEAELEQTKRVVGVYLSGATVFYEKVSKYVRACFTSAIRTLQEERP